ncbi:shikimate kinase [Desulfurobacterium pacificum]|uniref:Shikimate kinase n=1 Tax=Desulfurobacterium pacificum TaxID=240166 RepID=A0ABY1NCL8_9BACT|nr:shikimate kinase [Desulfurobacterium pacificum]SMP06466.1 shikimate kinase [Desulfurobacterium pacificum]
MKIALAGFMGCGKSSVGKVVAKELGWKFLDLDEEIERVTGKKIREIFESGGEEKFRRVEREVLESVLNREGNLVISLGGGTPTWGDNLSLLKEKALLIYLDTPFDVLWKRIEGDRERPLASLGKEKVKALFERRKKFYEEADLIVDTSGKSVEDVAEEVLTAFKEFVGSSRDENKG